MPVVGCIISWSAAGSMIDQTSDPDSLTAHKQNPECPSIEGSHRRNGTRSLQRKPTRSIIDLSCGGRESRRTREPSAGFVDDPSADDGHVDAHVPDFRRGDGEHVAIEHDEIRELPDLERAEVILVVGCPRAAGRVRA